MSRGRILIVDDSETVLEVVGERLRDAGYEVVELGSPLSLLPMVGTFRPHLVLLDASMGPLNGEVAPRILESLRRGIQVPVVLHSALPSAELARRVADSGASGFLLKTDDGGTALQQVASWVDQGRAALQEAPVPSVASRPPRAARVPLVVEARFEPDVAAGHTENISVTGLFVRTGAQFRPGERARLALQLSRPHEPMYLDVEIVRQRPGGAGSAAGVGVKLVPEDQAGRQKIEALVHGRL
jgi:CheY-like chemotaxis protein/Tfp pilus assembly protein PilZ